jgi:sec-independent protein translocase protein TatA
MTLAIFGLGVPELLIILAVVLLLFGGSRLAGLGKSTGRALKEFKEETKGLKSEQDPQPGIGGTTSPYEPGGSATLPPQQGQNPYQQGPVAQPYTDPNAGGTPYQQPPQAGPSNPDARRDV